MTRQSLGGSPSRRDLSAGQAYRVASSLLNSLARPFVVLPTQIDRRAPLETGEVKLLRYLLLSAIADIIAAAEAGPAGGERRANAAQAWRWMEGYPGAPIDFETACAAFGMSASAIRRRVARLRQRASQPTAVAPHRLTDRCRGQRRNLAPSACNEMTLMKLTRGASLGPAPRVDGP